MGQIGLIGLRQRVLLKPALSVRPFFGVSVTHNCSNSHHWISLIFCNKLAIYQCRKVMKPYFREKIIWPKNGPIQIRAKRTRVARSSETSSVCPSVCWSVCNPKL